MKLNIPNLLTLFRIAILPVAVLFYYLPVSYGHQLTACCVFIIGLTDFFDGYFARKWNQGTPFGAFLDPVADKLAVVTGCLVVTGYFCHVFITLCCLVIVAREILISALREWMAELGKRMSLKVQYIAKLKTFVQAAAFLILIWCNDTSPDWLFYIGSACLFVAVILTLLSMVSYLRVAWPDFVSST